MNSLSKKCLTKNNLIRFQKKFLNKTYRPTMYNLRLYYSNLKRNEHSYGKWDMVYGPDGMEKTQTDRNPDNYKYKSNLFHHTIYEMRHIYGDVLYQMFRRRHRLYDNFGLYVVPTSLVSLFLLSSSRISYREMALINRAFCYTQIKEGEKAKELYKKALEEFPDSGMAKAGVNMLESLKK